MQRRAFTAGFGPRRQPRASVRFDRLPNEDNDDRSYRWLRNWHWIAAAVHGVSAVLLLSLYLGLGLEDRKVTLFSDTVQSRDGTAVENKQISSYFLFWVLFPMPVVTALFHVVQALLAVDASGRNKIAQWYRGDIRTGVNAIRWIEYSVTASLMTWIVSQLSGMTNVYLLWLLAIVCNVAMQLTGWAHEVLQREGTNYNWVPFVTGSIIFLGQWTIIICYFLRSLAVADGDVPFYVQFIVWGLLGSFLGFPLVQVFYWGKFKPGRDEKNKNAWYWYEWLFIVLSIVSKLLLDWTLFLGIVSEQ